MPLVDFIVFVFAALVVLFFLTQVFVPLHNGRPLFPFFRHPGGNLENELAEANEDVAVARTERRVANVRDQAVRARAKRVTPPRPSQEDDPDVSKQ